MRTADKSDMATGSPAEGSKVVEGKLEIDSLLALETPEHRKILDILSRLPEGEIDALSTPQLVVCGAQSAGKSSVLEALTGIPFPRKCTRHATEIILRRAAAHSLDITVGPSPYNNSGKKRERTSGFCERMTSLSEIPDVMEKAAKVMGISDSTHPSRSRRSFSEDVLRIEIQGPTMPQLTIVDLPGIIESETEDLSQADANRAVLITESYISQPHTICLVVVSAMDDWVDQPILSKVRQFDRKGKRTLGIITKPDSLARGSERENAFLRLAKNEEISFTLGWHVLKNRSSEQAHLSLQDRNLSELICFHTSIFESLGPARFGIDCLINRIGEILFSRVRLELPKLKGNLEKTLRAMRSAIRGFGEPRTTAEECRTYLSNLSMDFHEVCKAAVNGYYEGEYFRKTNAVKVKRQISIRRLRAVINLKNQQFSDELEHAGGQYDLSSLKAEDSGQKPNISSSGEAPKSESDGETEADILAIHPRLANIERPRKLATENVVNWVENAILRANCQELPRNLNSRVIAELFWEQSSKWHLFAWAHIAHVFDICRRFLSELLRDKAPRDVYAHLWPRIQDKLDERAEAAVKELGNILDDVESFPLDNNLRYWSTVTTRENDRRKDQFTRCLEDATEKTRCSSYHEIVHIDKAVRLYQDESTDRYTPEEVLDYLAAIYKACREIFIANVTAQVIDRHILRGLERIFCPLMLSQLTDPEVVFLVSEPRSAKAQRDFLLDREAVLLKGLDVLQEVVSVGEV